MTTTSADPAAVAAFLDADARQVWARTQDGSVVFLPDGAAEEWRPRAQSGWRCLDPACPGGLTTVGGTTQRHHFRHLTGSDHRTAPESLAHLAAKAMLADWARHQTPSDAHVTVEHQIRTRSPHIPDGPPPDRELGGELGGEVRVADVLATWGTGQRWAFEVEYKHLTVHDWQAKLDDYTHPDARLCGATWLLGHTRLHGLADRPGLVRLPAVAREWARTGRTVLAINPLTRHVGTLLHPSATLDQPRPLTARETVARLVVDSIDDCTLDPSSGLLTPPMRHDRAAATGHAAKATSQAMRPTALGASDHQEVTSPEWAPPGTETIYERIKRLAAPPPPNPTNPTSPGPSQDEPTPGLW